MVYLAFINIIAFFICCLDKHLARVNAWRISEKLLFTVSLIGGALGMYIAMRIIHHKTLHKRFMIGLPIIIILQVLFFLFLTRII